MKFTFLGTSSAFSYPEAFCYCENCRKARQAGGKSIRRRSAAIINDDLLIDLGPDIITASEFQHIPLTNVQHCLLTHPHADHLDVSHLIARNRSFGAVDIKHLNLFGSDATLKRADQLFQQDIPENSLFDTQNLQNHNLSLHPVAAMETFQAGEYSVTAFPADHAPDFDAFLYAIEKDGRSIFYGTDTESIFEEDWQAFHSMKMKFDLVILDHTFGVHNAEFGHMNAQRVKEYTQRFRQEGLLKEAGQVYITHIGHNGNPIHSELVKLAQVNGYQVAFDGLVLNI